MVGTTIVASGGGVGHNVCMRHRLLGQVWEAFYVEQRKVGFMWRLTTAEPESDLITTRLIILYGRARIQHTFSFYERAGFPAHSYLFDANDGAAIHARFVNGQILCQVDDDVVAEAVSADARPRYGNYPLIVTMPFEVGYRVPFTQIDDASGTVFGKIELVSQGWRSVQVGGQPMKLWLVDEYSRVRLGNRYWLDEQRRIRLTQWQGATSRWVATKAEAFAGLSAELIAQAQQLLSGTSTEDLTSEIEAWLQDN